MAVPLSKTPLFCSEALTETVVWLPISSTHYGHLSLSHLSCGAKARLVPSLRTAAQSRRDAPPLPSRAPGPPRQTLSPSLSAAPVRSLRLVGHSTHPLSLPPGSPNHPLSYGTSVRCGRKGRNSIYIRGPLFRERGSSFARDPLTPLAWPGSIRPLSGTPLSDHPFARPMRFAPVLLPQGQLPSCSVSRRSFVATPAQRLLVVHLPALAWKTLFGCLRETSTCPFVLKDSLGQAGNYICLALLATLPHNLIVRNI